MANVTLSIDDELIRAARKVAIDRHTSVNQLVREYLTGLVRESDERRVAREQLDDIFGTARVKVGRRNWTRDDLHER